MVVATAKVREVDQLDVKGAFLHATLPDSDREWIRLPTIKGVPSVSGQIVLLHKSLNGLRHAPKLWY